LKNGSEKENNSTVFYERFAPMALASPKYKSLMNVVDEWSAESGDLPPVTLRRICDWAICGGFPEGTFALPTGQAIDLLELHRAMRIALGMGAPINQDLAFEILRRAIVSKDGIKDYCERIGIDPPRSMRTLRSRFRVSKRGHSGPTECPNSAKVVGQLEAGCTAIGFMNTIEKLPKRRDCINAEVEARANERWLCYLEHAQPHADASGDPEIQRRLAALRHDWEGPKTLTNEPSAGSRHSEESSGSGPADDKKRGIGRPQGSGSWEIDDLKLVKEMRQKITSGEFRSITAAAKAMLPKAPGSGTDASKEQRLRKRYSEKYPS
jgi:hypothetical protein